MDNDIIQTYLWHDVIKLGFSPSGKKKMKEWLLMYGRSLYKFWELDVYPPNPKSNGVIKAELSSSQQIEMIINYSITDRSKFSVQFLHIDNKRELMWTHDVDGKYFAFPEQSLSLKYKKKTKKIISNKHVEKVVDGLIIHPRVHQHIECPINHHEIRIGGGIYNPFVFLFHLRYQLCPIKQKREEEKKRIIELFTNAIKNDSTITANDLLPIN
jgi:hypothetical protein